MDRTIKVTGFYLKSHVERRVIENKLRFLFLGVGQVEQVSLSEDRNSARVRFYHRDALNFVSKQEWRLGSSHLRVKPFVPPSDDQDNARPSPVQLSCKPELPGNKDTPQKYSLSSYCDSRNKFWVDIPHETFTVVSCATPRRKRKRCCNLDLQHASFQQSPKRKKRKTKPGKKKKNAQLESFAPLPFGITCISQEKAQAQEPSEKENQRTSVREIFIKGTKTVATSIPWTATAAEVREVVSAATKVPENLLHVTVDGRTLTDDAALGMTEGCTLHYSIRGKGGMQKGDEADLPPGEIHGQASSIESQCTDKMGVPPAELSKSARKKQRKKAVRQSEEDSGQGDDATKQSLDPAVSACTSSLTKMQESSAEEFMQAVSTSGAAQSEVAGDGKATEPRGSERKNSTTSEGAIPWEADEESVHQWLLKVCRLLPEHLPEFDGMDGKTLYKYSSFESLLEDVKIPYGKARSILFRRDFATYESKMLQWTVEDVKNYIRVRLEKPELDLHNFDVKEIDGTALLSFKDGGELKHDLDLKGVIAKRIMAERDSYINEERRQATEDSGIEKTPVDFSSLPADENGKQQKVVRECEDQALAAHEAKIISFNKNKSAFGCHKMFLQNVFHLQCLQLPVSAETLTESFLSIFRLKVDEPSFLDKQFLFFILCCTCFSNAALQILWKTIRNCKHTLWKEKLEKTDRIEFEDAKLLLDGKEIEFTKTAKPSLVYLANFEQETQKRYDQYPVSILLVDQQLLKSGTDSQGYSCRLAIKKKSPVYQFGFEKGQKYFIFDSEDFASGIKNENIPDSQIGHADRCFLQWEEENIPVDMSATVSDTNVLEENLHKDANALNRGGSTEATHSEIESEKNPLVPFDRQLSSRQIALRYVFRRQFKTDPTRSCIVYKERHILDVLECAGDQSTELKYYESDKDPNKEIFLLKSLTFICGCLNSRKNGTIYFGVPEDAVNGKHFEYGEIVGVYLEKQEQEKYQVALRGRLARCFSSSFSVVEQCVYGPYFIRVKPASSNTAKQKCVIEIDVEPKSDLCQESYFEFDASKLGAHLEKKSGVYLRDTGGKDGTVQTRRLQTEELEKFRLDLPELAEQRQKKETSWNHPQKNCIKSEASKLKRFMENCDDSVRPLLVTSAPTEDVKQNMETSLRFVKFIPWAAIFDFDNFSAKDGLFHLYQSSPSTKHAKVCAVKSLNQKTIETQRESLCMASEVLWFFANGDATDRDFEKKEYKEWHRNYYPHVKDAVIFLQDRSVISKQRHFVLVLVSAEMENDIVTTVDDIASSSNIGLIKMFLIFDHEWTQKQFIQKSSHADDLLERSAVLPWQDAQRVVMDTLDLEHKDKHKDVVTASGSLAQIPPHQWMALEDLDILSAKECEENCVDEDSAKAEMEEIKFYRGGKASWHNFYYPNHVMQRTIQPDIEKEILHLSQETSSSSTFPKVTVYHIPGTGGSTLAKQVLWSERKSYKCAVIKQITQKTFQHICEFWAAGETTSKEQWKPVILLSDDNTTPDIEVTESELCDKIFRCQKHYRLQKPIAILITCRRSIRHGSDGFSLKQKLSNQEELWMVDTYTRLDKKKCKSKNRSFLGLLSLRVSFDPKKIESSVAPYLSDEQLGEKERNLILYIALIIMYFPPSMGYPGVPVSACDLLLNKKEPWEKSVSGVADHILVINTDMKGEVVRTPNKAIAKAVLKFMRTADKLTLAEIVIDCLNSPLVSKLDLCERHYAMLTKKIIGRMLTERYSELGGMQFFMSPLILQIKEESSSFAVTCERQEEEEVAVIRILELAHEQLGGGIFLQQIARFCCEEEQFENAVKNAKKAVASSPKTTEFIHTLGHVHERYFYHIHCKKGNSPGVIKDHEKELTVALNGWKHLSEAERCKDAVTKSYACCDKIKLINCLLSYITARLLRPDDVESFSRFLTEPDFDMNHFDALPKLKKKVKNILRKATEVLRYMYYFGLSYGHISSPEKDSKRQERAKYPLYYTNKDCVIQFNKLIGLVNDFIVLDTRGDVARRIRFENLKLRGCFFESIMDFVVQSNEEPNERNSNYNQLKKIGDNLMKIDDNNLVPEDMDNYIAVCLAMELVGKEQKDNSFTSQCSDLYDLCKRIILSPNDPVRTMRAHLYRVLICWPTWSKSRVFIPQQFEDAFHHTPTLLTIIGGHLLPRVHFFIAKKTASFHLCHWTEIFKIKRLHTSQQWKEQAKDQAEGGEEQINAVMHEKLQQFEGVSKQKAGSEKYAIELKMGDYSDKFSKCLTIRALRGEQVCRDANVSFFLGFSLGGPVAYVYHVE